MKRLTMNNRGPMGIPLNVLIVEDSENDTLLLVRDLRRGEYDVRYERVQTADEFTQALRRQDWHVIIADYTIPGFSGLEALRLLQSQEKDIPFIVMSGVIDEDNATAIEALKAGAHDFIVKGRTARLLPAIDRELREAEQRAIRRDIEAKYRRSEERLRLALDATRISVWEWDILSGRITYGEYFEELFGEPQTEADVSHERFMERIHPEDREMVLQAIMATIKHGVAYDVQFRVIWPDSSIHWLHSQGCAYSDENGEPVSMAGVLQNVTYRKQLEEIAIEQARLKVEMEKERQLATLRNRFMMVAAHEFRTPLTVISSANELLYEMYDELPAEKHKEYLQEISSRVKHLREMLTQIESVTRDEHIPVEFSPHPTDVKRLCKQIMSDIQRSSQQSHHIELVAECSRCDYNIDSRLVTHIVSNLLSNAVKYSKKGSEVVLHVSEEAGELVFRVVDQGIGIPPDDLQSIYDLFFRGSNIGAVGGRGIGLKIVKDSVDAHNGTIEVESEVGRGTTFTVRLPI
jgi:PAS domain S-box-containing protein